MAQPQPIKVVVDLDVSQARRRTKRIKSEVEALNRDLAQLEDRLAEMTRQHDEVIRTAYRIDIDRKDTTQ